VKKKKVLTYLKTNKKRWRETVFKHSVKQKKKKKKGGSPIHLNETIRRGGGGGKKAFYCGGREKGFFQGIKIHWPRGKRMSRLSWGAA